MLQEIYRSIWRTNHLQSVSPSPKVPISRNVALGEPTALCLVPLLEFDQHDVRVVSDAIEDDLLAVWTNVEASRNCSRRQVRKLAPFTGGHVDYPQPLAVRYGQGPSRAEGGKNLFCSRLADPAGAPACRPESRP